MALITSVLSSAAGTFTLSCDLLYLPIKGEKDRQNETESVRMLTM